MLQDLDSDVSGRKVLVESPFLDLPIVLDQENS
jgi:hypothetical protein